jgi:hypothetical protein
MIMEWMHNMGVRSEHLYMAGFVSVGVAFASWMASRKPEKQGVERAGSWGIFIGEWAPTFIGMGNALRTYEK